MKIRLRTVILITLIISVSTLVGQFSETINTNRPGQSNGSSTVGQQVFQMESGGLFNKTATDDHEQESYNLGTTFRYGFLEHLETYASLGYTDITSEVNTHKSHSSGLSGTEFGLIWHALVEKGARPSLAVQGGLMPRWVSTDFKSENLGERLAILLGKDLSDSFSLTSNLSSIWDGSSSNPATSYTLSLSYAAHERVGTFIEIYGDLDPGTAHLDGGLTYALNMNSQVDCWLGLQGANGAEDWFLGLGYSWRIKG